MKRVGIGTEEPGDGAPLPEIPIRITVPEEFIGSAIAEVNARRGRITGMEGQGGPMTIKASLSASELDGLRDEIASWTQGQGKAELEAAANH